MKFNEIYKNPILFRGFSGIFLLLMALLMFFGFSWYLAITLIFLILFFWWAYEKRFFSRKINIWERLTNILFWILILVLVLSVFKKWFFKI
jgi:hypothetical protein